MIRLQHLALAALIGGVPVIAACQPPPAVRQADAVARAARDEPPVQWFKNDKEMDAAVTRAQETLPVFWRAYDARLAAEPSYYLVKAPFPTQRGGEEHLWLEVLGHSGDEVQAVVLNEPEDVRGVHAGQKTTVRASRLSDWSYDRNGRRWGNFTTRVMLKHMAPRDAAEYGAQLSETPLESGEH